MYNFVLFMRWLVSITEIRLSEQSLPAECDIRSCLNTLQFLNKKKEALNIVSELIEIATCWLMLLFNKYVSISHWYVSSSSQGLIHKSLDGRTCRKASLMFGNRSDVFLL